MGVETAAALRRYCALQKLSESCGDCKITPTLNCPATLGVSAEKNRPYRSALWVLSELKHCFQCGTAAAGHGYVSLWG